MSDPLRELDEVMGDLEMLLKNPDVGAALTEKKVNTSLAMVLLDGMRAYVKGDKERAVEEIETFIEEVKGRLALSSPRN